MHYVVIIDPGIMVYDDYPAYTAGLADDLYVKDVNGGYYLGQVGASSPKSTLKVEYTLFLQSLCKKSNLAYGPNSARKVGYALFHHFHII